VKTLLCFFVLAVLGMPLAAQEQHRAVPTIHASKGARLLAWTIDGQKEFSVFVPFNDAAFNFVERAFIAFNNAYASGAYDVGFEREFTVSVEFGGPTVKARAHITRYDGPASMWFEFLAYDTICFSDSLTLETIQRR